ncbi:MAG: glutamine-hydrolyzing GMP synthase [Candidatus Diapherotrites archaeon]|nr:glutamine-hydrolyzing GMP synthase [Candidatus Diapherotrites archaeon]
MQKQQKILVLDFGSQYTHLLARRVRELGVFSEILLPTVSSKELSECAGVILSGGPASVYEKEAPEYNKEIFSCGKPVLGLCYGQQLMGHFFGGKILPGKRKEYGLANLLIKKKPAIFEGLSKKQIVWMSHGDQVKNLPQGFELVGTTDDCQIAAMGDEKRKMFGLQFHPEVTHTKNGMKILSNFLFKICGCKKNWSAKNILGKKLKEIKQTVGKKKIFLLASGGVDSTVALVMFAKALKSSQIFALHVDHGFMRKDESVQVKAAMEKTGFKNLKIIDASKLFFEKLKVVIDPKEKRKIIGQLFVDAANQEISKMGVENNDWLLGQGTIYPDTIETQGTRHAARIKTHHNQADIIKKLSAEGKVVEPLRDLYKDEVRVLGKKLGLPKEIVWRQPFPGPGLAIRVLCSNGKKEETEKIEQKSQKIAKRFGFNSKILPVKAVGVQGDFRTYRFVCALQGTMDWKKLEAASTRITNELKEINRVVFCMYQKKIVSVKLLEAYLSKERVSLLQKADEIAMSSVQKVGLLEKIWQFPIVLLPVQINGVGESIVLRPVFSREAMTAKFAVLPKKVLKEIVSKISKTMGIGAVFFDVTHKPPGTIEWE